MCTVTHENIPTVRVPNLERMKHPHRIRIFEIILEVNRKYKIFLNLTNIECQRVFHESD